MKLDHHIALFGVASVLLTSIQTTLAKEVTPVMATWQYGIHALPSTATISGDTKTFKSSPGEQLWTISAEKELKQVVKLPAALYLHGCSGFTSDAGKYRRFMLSLGYAVFMPDSFQRPGRRACRQAGPMAQRIEIRKEEIKHALSRIRQMSWVNQNQVILMGFSEGGNTTDNWDEKGFAAHIVLGSACTHTGTGMPAAPKGTPVLAIVGEQDDHRPGESCHVVRTVGGSKSISLPDAGHKIAHRLETKTSIFNFLRKCCSYTEDNSQSGAKNSSAGSKGSGLAARDQGDLKKNRKRILSESEVRETIIGNTLSFLAPSNSRKVYVYFAKGGEVLLKVAGRAKVFKKKWTLDGRGSLCRTAGKKNRKHCTRVRTSGEAKTIFLFNKNNNYEAKIIEGRHLPK